MRSEWTTGRSAYLDVPKPPSPSTIGKTGPRQMNIHLGTGGPEPSQAGQHPSGGTPSGEPPAWTGPRSDPRVRTRDNYILRLGPANPGLPGSQCNAAAARRHGSRSREANFRSVWIPTGPALRTTRRGHHLPGTAQIDAQGLSIRAGDYHPSSAASGRRPSARPNAWNNDSEGCRTQATRHLLTALLSGRPGAGGTHLVPTLIPQILLSG